AGHRERDGFDPAHAVSRAVKVEERLWQIELTHTILAQLNEHQWEPVLQTDDLRDLELARVGFDVCHFQALEIEVELLPGEQPLLTREVAPLDEALRHIGQLVPKRAFGLPGQLQRKLEALGVKALRLALHPQVEVLGAGLSLISGS